MDDHYRPDDWQSWLQRHAAQLLLFARQQTRSESDAEDVLQDALVESWQRKGAAGVPPLPLVYATIRRRAMDLGRSHDRRLRREGASTPFDSGMLTEQSAVWFDSTAEERERTRILESAMKELQPIYRDVVMLKIWGDLTFAEIAEALEIPANTAASRFRYGLEALRKQLKVSLP